jgi:hypothetical protein
VVCGEGEAGIILRVLLNCLLAREHVSARKSVTKRKE